MKRPDWLKLSPPVVFGLVTVGVLGLAWVVIYLPQLQTASLRQGVEDYRSSLPKPDPEKLATLEKGRIDSENAIRTGLIQGIGGTVLLIGLYFTYQNLKATQRNVEIAEDKQVTERFSKAVDMLSSASMHTRLGGIYALERIARDSDDDYWQVMEVLTAFVRSESPWPPKTEETETEGATAEANSTDQVAEESAAPSALVAAVEASQSVELQAKLSEQEQLLQVWEQEQKEREERLAKLPSLRTDIQAVMTVIGRRKYRYKEGETQRLDLSKTDLRQLQARGANLTGVDLTGAHLEHTFLIEVRLEEADLSEAHLEQAILWEAHLEHTFLIEARLEEADLKNAFLEHADLREAHLEKANLVLAHLEHADLREAHLEKANLVLAHLEHADLREAHLEKADLCTAHLEKANLTEVDLSQVRYLTQAQLDSARTNQLTKRPDYLLAAQPQAEAPIAPPSPTTPEPSSEPQPPAT